MDDCRYLKQDLKKELKQRTFDRLSDEKYLCFLLSGSLHCPKKY